MNIFRVQHMKTGLGPYTNNNKPGYFYQEIQNMMDKHNFDIEKWPSPVREMLHYVEPGELCGFLSLKQLGEWFSNDDLVMLIRHEYNMVFLTHVKIIAKGKKQIVFEKTECTSVKVLLAGDIVMENNMTWNKAFCQLQKELGREPSSNETQRRMLELLFGDNEDENQQNCKDD